MSTVVMQSLAYVQHSSPVPGAKLSVSGDLRLMQRTPLPHRGLHDVYNVSVRSCSRRPGEKGRFRNGGEARLRLDE